MIRAHQDAARTGWILVALLAAACQGASSTVPSVVGSEPTEPPVGDASPVTTAAPIPPPVPDGRIAYMRMDPDGLERYLTINSDGTDARELYTAEGCGCVHWMADGSRVMSLAASGDEVWSLMTMRPDGTDRVVIPAPIKTLSLAVGATSSDGKWLAFNGWDNKVPSNAGLYRAHADLTALRLVLPLQDGMLAIEPFGVTPDGARIVFFAETGPDAGITHAGDVYVVDADGTRLRRLNPPGTRAGFYDAPAVSISPDGRRAAFAAGDAVYVADLETGEATRITDDPGGEWFVEWSPAGEWITYTAHRSGTNVIVLVHPDGSDAHDLTTPDVPGGYGYATWSPDGTTLLMARGNGDADRDLWIIDLEGNELGQVTEEPGQYSFYSWAPAP